METRATTVTIVSFDRAAVFELEYKEVGMKPDNEFKKNPNFFQDLILFIRNNKKWYLIPIAVSIILLGILIALGSTGAAPFIYTLF